MSRIFVSYRREDSSGYTGRIQERLIAELGKKKVFYDIGAIQPGKNFELAINESIDKSRYLIAVIGKEWPTAKDEDGQLRLHDPDDYVRLEIESALRKNISIIPVLVHGARMPRAQDLPETVQEFARIQPLELRDTRWEADMEALLRLVSGPPILRKILRAKKQSLAFLFIPVVIPIVFFLTQDPVNDAEHFLTLLAKGDFHNAYLDTAYSFQKDTDESTFIEEIRRIGLEDNASSFWNSRNLGNGTARLTGTVTTKQRRDIPLTITLVKEDEKWKVLDFELSSVSKK